MSRPNHDTFGPDSRDPALRVTALDLLPGPAAPGRSNGFTVARAAVGAGTFWAGDGRHPFAGPCLLFASPYQPTRFAADAPVSGDVVRFHANFLCVETVHHEVGCNGVLFNDPYGSPVVPLDEPATGEFSDLIGRIRRELADPGPAQAEALLAYLKLLLVLATRLKLRRCPVGSPGLRRPPLLDAFRDLFESHYRELHAPAEYASRLGVTPRPSGGWSARTRGGPRPT